MKNSKLKDLLRKGKKSNLVIENTSTITGGSLYVSDFGYFDDYEYCGTPWGPPTISVSTSSIGSVEGAQVASASGYTSSNYIVGIGG